MSITKQDLQLEGRYNFKGQGEKLVYIGSRRYAGDCRTWYQFAKVENPYKVWCELLEADLHMLEKTT